MLEERKVNSSGKKKNLKNISLKHASQILDHLKLRNAHELLKGENYNILTTTIDRKEEPNHTTT